MFNILIVKCMAQESIKKVFTQNKNSSLNINILQNVKKESTLKEFKIVASLIEVNVKQKSNFDHKKNIPTVDRIKQHNSITTNHNNVIESYVELEKLTPLKQRIRLSNYKQY